MKNSIKAIGVTIATLAFTSAAYAEEVVASASVAGITDKGLAAIGAFLGLGIAALAGGLGQAKVAAAALEGTARNPQAYNNLFTVLILSLAFIESLTIYALVIAFVKG